MQSALNASAPDPLPASLRRRLATHKALVDRLFLNAGICVNGERPFDIRVNNDGFYRRVLADGALGIGEAYVDGWWDADRVDEVMCRLARANQHQRLFADLRLLLSVARIRLNGIGNRAKAFEVAKRHYDLGNDLFRTMLDERMIYSCAYWKDAVSLDQAQENKLDLVCRKLALQPGMRVLEIGCGWGGWAKFAAQKYGVSVVGVTVSAEQLAFGKEYCAGLPIDLRLQDYRRLNETFDRVVSIGMFEHVGNRHHRTFMNVVDRCLNDDGLFLLHTIVGNEPVGSAQSPWIVKYIFPHSEIPSLRQISAASERLFVTEAMHHFGSDYEKTLTVWYDQFVSKWPTIETTYGKRFFRMWTFYLLLARGLFQARVIHLWQAVFSKRSAIAAGAEAADADARSKIYDSR